MSSNNEENDNMRPEVEIPMTLGTVNSINSPIIPSVLPHDQFYKIRYGNKTIEVSGESLSYDSPSYFTDYFSVSPCSTLFVDRSSQVFEKIILHLQGYSIKIEDDFEFIYLLMDANFFRLKRLKERILQEGIIINVGGEIFKLPKELLYSKGNYPNFFTIVYQTILDDPFMNKKFTIRPPPITPYTCNRSAELFKDILFGLSGNSIAIKDETHRSNLISDCRYYQFFALEQKLINSQIIKNPFNKTEEIVINYQDIKKDGLLNDTLDSMIGLNHSFTVVKYSRPYIDANIYRDLILQICSAEVNLMVNPSLNFVHLLLFDKTAIAMKSILSKVTDDYIFEKSEDNTTLTVLIELHESIGILNDLKMERGWLNTLMNVNKEDSTTTEAGQNKVIVIKLLKSQWTINVQGRSKIWMDCLKFEGVLDKSSFNSHREFI